MLRRPSEYDDYLRLTFLAIRHGMAKLWPRSSRYAANAPASTKASGPAFHTVKPHHNLHLVTQNNVRNQTPRYDYQLWGYSELVFATGAWGNSLECTMVFRSFISEARPANISESLDLRALAFAGKKRVHCTARLSVF